MVFHIHVREVFWQTDHLCTFFGTLLHKPLANTKVLFNIVSGLELDKTNYTLKVVLLGRKRVLVIRNSIQNA